MQEPDRRTPTEVTATEDGRASPSAASEFISFVSELASRYELAAIHPFLRVCEAAAIRKELNIAILGRFKAGKSSFINHFIGRELLPVGVVPVTSVVTELQWGRHDQAQVRFWDGRTELVSPERIGDFVTELKNPENLKGVSTVEIRVPEIAQYAGLRFIDTPGLESAHAHNTEASLAWVPNVDFALVAIGVDPPLSQQDVALIHKLFEYTPKVCVLLTKVDVLTEQERQEVLQFIRTQLNRNFSSDIEVFPYSIRPGFEQLKSSLDYKFIRPTLESIRAQKQEVVRHKLRTLLRECGDYLQLTLRSAEMLDAERQRLRDRVLGEKHGVSDTRLELQLIAKHNIGAARNHIERTLTPFENSIQRELRDALDVEYDNWKLSFARILEQFEYWLRNAITSRLNVLSSLHKPEFLKPVRDVQRQYLRVLQAFRDRLSARTLELFGVPLRTTETEIDPEPPKAPDINIGRIFDHNWELLSAIIPMAVFRRLVKSRFGDRIDYETTKNLSRLTTQWADIVALAITSMQREAERRLDDLMKTVEHLTTSAAARAPEIRLDLERTRQAEAALETDRI